MGKRNSKTVLKIPDVPAYVEKICNLNGRDDKFHIYLYSSGDGFFHIEHNGYG